MRVMGAWGDIIFISSTFLRLADRPQSTSVGQQLRSRNGDAVRPCADDGGGDAPAWEGYSLQGRDNSLRTLEHVGTLEIETCRPDEGAQMGGPAAECSGAQSIFADR